MSLAEHIVERLRSASQRLIDALALVAMQAIEIGVQVAIEGLHVGVAFGRPKLEDLDEILVVVEHLVARIPSSAQRNPRFASDP